VVCAARESSVLLKWQKRNTLIPMSLRTVTVKLHDRLLSEIEAVARSRRVSRSEILRERLAQGDAPNGSVWERMQDLVIAEDHAPADLASNKARLRGYGRSRSR
jgi:hypothetical protein